MLSLASSVTKMVATGRPKFYVTSTFKIVLCACNITGQTTGEYGFESLQVQEVLLFCAVSGQALGPFYAEERDSWWGVVKTVTRLRLSWFWWLAANLPPRSPFKNWGGERTTFCRRSSVSSWHCHYTSSPFSFIHPSPTLYYFSNCLTD
jgi:hypothetical protein